MKRYLYYFDTKNDTLRRFPVDAKELTHGEKWDGARWTQQCCRLRSVLMTGDVLLSEGEVHKRIPSAIE